MSFKNIMKTIGIAGIVAIAGIGAAHALGEAGGPTATGICGLITQMGGVFKTLRTMAFIGAAFCIAGWAWGYISAGSIGEKGAWGPELKTKGVALIVGFVLLFGVGVLLSFLMGKNGACSSQISAAFQ